DTSVARYALAAVLGPRLGMCQGLALGLGRKRRNDATLHQPAGFALVDEMLLEDLGVNPKWGVVVEARGQGIRGSPTGGPIAAIGKSGDRGGQAEHGNRREKQVFHRSLHLLQSGRMSGLDETEDALGRALGRYPDGAVPYPSGSECNAASQRTRARRSRGD